MYTLHKSNVRWEACCGYCVMGVKPGDSKKEDGDPFLLPLVRKIIKDTEKQPENVEIVKENP